MTTAAVLKTAREVKGAIEEVLKRVRFGQPLRDDQLPRFDTAGQAKAPNGDPLFRVQLSSSPPPGAADLPSTYALVNPKTNEFYSMTSGGLAGRTFAHGPVALPADTQFKGKSYTAAEVKALGKAAQAAPPKPRLQHYAASVRSATWSPGLGARLPPPGAMGTGIRASITLPYIDVSPKWKVSTNEQTHTITVTLDGTSPSKVHAMVKPGPQDLSIPVNRPKDLGAEYKIVFKNPEGKQLFKTSFKNIMPA